MLFLLTLVVTLPSLYVFSALLGVRVTAMDTLRIIVAAIAVNLTLLASFAPITAFFTLSTDNYFFMKLLNVLFFTIAGIISLKFLSRMMWAMEQGCLMREVSDDGLPVAALAEEGAPNPPAGARAPMARLVPELSSPVKRLFRVWLVMYAVVGAQMAWVLRPFVGAPNMEFTWFREKQANFFLDILRSLHQLLS
jgi:hypothetical protein